MRLITDTMTKDEILRSKAREPLACYCGARVIGGGLDLSMFLPALREQHAVSMEPEDEYVRPAERGDR